MLGPQLRILIGWHVLLLVYISVATLLLIGLDQARARARMDAQRIDQVQQFSMALLSGGTATSIYTLTPNQNVRAGALNRFHQARGTADQALCNLDGLNSNSQDKNITVAWRRYADGLDKSAQLSREAMDKGDGMGSMVAFMQASRAAVAALIKLENETRQYLTKLRQAQQQAMEAEKKAMDVLFFYLVGGAVVFGVGGILIATFLKKGLPPEVAAPAAQ